MSNNDSVFVSDTDWDNWKQANSNLVNLLRSAIVFTTTNWKKFEIGWVEVTADEQ